MNAIRLSEQYTKEQLIAMEQSLCSDPANRANGQRGIFLYTKEAQRKIDAIRRAIQIKLDESNGVKTIPGYTGRQSKRR